MEVFLSNSSVFLDMSIRSSTILYNSLADTAHNPQIDSLFMVTVIH